MENVERPIVQIPCIDTDDHGVSVFTERLFIQNHRGGMLLTDRIDAQNFRIRTSAPGYATDWHLAGDPTLISIQQGVLRVSLQNGEYRDFSTGDMFIAADNLPVGMTFDPEQHGHKATVIGNETLKAIHIKLGADF